MTIHFDIEHTTRYRFARPVMFGEHRVMFRPRDSHDLRVLATDLLVHPEPDDIRLIQDVYSNSIAIVQPRSPASELELVARFTVEHVGTRVLDLPLDPSAEGYPFVYRDDEREILLPFLTPWYDDPAGIMANWAHQFVQPAGNVGTREILVAMTRHIRDSMIYRPRYEEGVQTPYRTIELNSGTCRDFATLMIEAVRHLGYAARFVSGYLWSGEGDPRGNGHIEPGATHAWVQVYLPGAGWLPFDPTNNLVGGDELVRVGVSRHASQASPVRGTWFGCPTDYLGMDVDVQVRKRL